MGAFSKFISAFTIEFGRLWWHLTHAGSRTGLVKKQPGRGGKRPTGRKRTRWALCEQCQRNRMACVKNCGRCFECCTRHGKAVTW